MATPGSNASLQIGDKVVWFSTEPEVGTVKWVGSLPDVQNETFVGVEFVNPVGTGTGKYGKRRLFTAKQNHASLVPLLGLMKYEDVYGDEAGGASRSLTQPSSSYHSHRSRNIHPENQVVQDLREQNHLLQEQIRLQREQLHLQQQLLRHDEKLPASQSTVVPSAPPSYEECMTDTPKDSKESQDKNQKP